MNLHEARLETLMTQQEISVALGISHSHYHYIETYRSIPSVILAMKISLIVGVPVAELFDPSNYSYDQLHRSRVRLLMKLDGRTSVVEQKRS